MPNFGLGSNQVGTSWEETGIMVGDPIRYKSKDVIRLTKSDTPYENLNVYIPGTQKRSAADEKLDKLFEKQQKKFNSLNDYEVPKFCKGEILEPEIIHSGIINKNIEENNNKIKFSNKADPEILNECI